MTETISSCAELYKHDSGFRGFIHAWKKTRRCPLELVDYLLEWGLERQAENARWAATTGSQPVSTDETPNAYPYPGMRGGNFWWYACGGTLARFVPSIPGNCVRPNSRGLGIAVVRTYAQAFCWLLDNREAKS